MGVDSKRVTVHHDGKRLQATKIQPLGARSSLTVWKVELLEGEGSKLRVSLTENFMSKPTPIIGDLVAVPWKDKIGQDDFYHVLEVQPTVLDLRRVSDGTEATVDSSLVVFPTEDETLYVVCRYKGLQEVEQYLTCWEQDWISYMSRIDARMVSMKVDSKVKSWKEVSNVGKLREAINSILVDRSV